MLFSISSRKFKTVQQEEKIAQSNYGYPRTGVRRLQFKQKMLVMTGMCAICFARMAHSQSAIDEFQPLIATSAHRLAIAEQVALSKWDSGAAVEDTQREEQVITNAVKTAETKGLDPESVSSFFKSQIEANKLIQYSLLSNWRRSGKAPDHPAVSLGKTIRPELDQIQTELIAELAATATVRADASCQVNIAEAAGRFSSEHAKEITPLQAIALDRALATTCVSKEKSK
jgi:chorismate mutase